MTANRDAQDERSRGLPISRVWAGVLLAAVLSLLLALYWFVLRTEYVVVFERLQESDAAAVAAELTERKIDHRLANGGRTILVASEEADQARLDIASSELPLRGQVGFELFNQSDMGLTEFAQKINYQRALQGELARTIMLLDGIENARVHLAMPERTLFRGNRSEPTAAVTLILQPGHSIPANRIIGIQRLIARSVPDLSVANVAILDETGRLVSSDEADLANTEDSGETAAISQYYRAHIGNAIAGIAPNLDHRVRVLVRQRVEMSIDSATNMPTTDSAPAAHSMHDNMATGRDRRNYALEVEVTTAVPIAPLLRDQLSAAIIQAAGLDQSQDDRLIFGVGQTGALATTAAMPTAAAVSSSHPAVSPLGAARWEGYWQWYLAIIAAIMVGAGASWWWFARMRGVAAKDEMIVSFAEQLRASLAAAEAGHG